MNILVTGIKFEFKELKSVYKDRQGELSYGTRRTQITKLYGINEDKGVFVEVSLIPQETISEDCPYDIVFGSKIEIKEIYKIPARMEFDATPYEFKIIQIEEGENTSQSNELFSINVKTSQNPLENSLNIKMDNIFIYPF